MKAPRSARFAWVAAASMLAGCASDPPALAQTAARRSNVAPPSLSMPARFPDAAPLSRIPLVARTHGGEAMLFTVDWKVLEGEAGGRIEPGRRSDDGSYAATYVAPAMAGTYHVTATIREFPAATATAEVRVR